MLRELAEGVYLETGFAGGNVGLILSERGDLLVDTPMFPADARRWRVDLVQMERYQIYGIVNTDYHPEHFWGNDVFMPTRTFGNELSTKPIAKYATAGLEQFAARYREANSLRANDIAQIKIHPPEIRVDDRLTLHLGDRTVEVLHLEGHTPASLGVYLPQERILFAGDNIVNDEHPTMVHANSLAWLDTLMRIQEMEVDVIVPGVGEPCGKEAIPPLREYITEMRRRIGDMFLKGSSRRECVDRVGMAEYFPIPQGQENRIKLRKRESVERLYTEIRVALRKKR